MLTLRTILSLAALTSVIASCGPRPVDAARRDADFHYDYGRYAEAAPMYLEIIDRYPGDWEAEYRYGMCLVELGRPQQARTHIETASARKPDNREVCFALADVYASLDERARMTQLLKARAADFSDTGAYLKLATLARQLNDADLEEFAIQAALRMRSEGQWEAYVFDADRQTNAGDQQLALRRLRQAYFLNPNSPIVVAKLRERGEEPTPQTGLPPES